MKLGPTYQEIQRDRDALHEARARRWIDFALNGWMCFSFLPVRLCDGRWSFWEKVWYHATPPMEPDGSADWDEPMVWVFSDPALQQVAPGPQQRPRRLSL